MSITLSFLLLPFLPNRRGGKSPSLLSSLSTTLHHFSQWPPPPSFGKKGSCFRTCFREKGPFFSAEYFLSWPVQRRRGKLQTSDASSSFHEKRKVSYSFIEVFDAAACFFFIFLLEASSSFLGSKEMLFGKRGK